MLAENLPCMSQNVCVASFDYEADLPTWEGRVHVVIESERMEFSLGGGKSKRGKEGEQTREAALSCWNFLG